VNRRCWATPRIRTCPAPALRLRSGQASSGRCGFDTSAAGGAEGIRTPGLYSAIVALSQLSYSPTPNLILLHNGEMSRFEQHTTSAQAAGRVPWGDPAERNPRSGRAIADSPPSPPWPTTLWVFRNPKGLSSSNPLDAAPCCDPAPAGSPDRACPHRMGPSCQMALMALMAQRHGRTRIGRIHGSRVTQNKPPTQWGVL
jgi:hypothetical protein